MRKGFYWYDSIFILLFIYLFIGQIDAIWPFTIDDMFISLRYARHWSEGNGLLWNLNEPPVEGYSNFSFVALGALSLLLHVSPVVALKAAGVIGLFLSSVFVFLISRFWFQKREALLPCIALLLYKGEILWSVSGLEASVYQALICGAVYFSFRGMGYAVYPYSRKKSNNTFFILAGLMLSLAGMTRPEAPAFMILFFILICWDRPKSLTRNYWIGPGLFCLTLFLIYIPYFLWRWHYYGHLFPNTVYCKGLASADFALLDLNYLKLIWPFALMALPACLRSKDKRHYFLWLPSLVYLIMLLRSDPVVAFDNRLFLTAYALLLPLSLQGLSYLVLMILKQRDLFFIRTLYVLFLCISFLFIPWMTLSDYHYFSLNPIAGERLRKSLGEWLETNTKKGDFVVLSDSGMIPYYSRLNFIDSYCLNNATMAQYPKEHRYEKFCKQVLSEQHKIIILTSLVEGGQVIYTPSDYCLKIELSKQANYKLIRVFSSRDSTSIYRYELFTNY